MNSPGRHRRTDPSRQPALINRGSHPWDQCTHASSGPERSAESNALGDGEEAAKDAKGSRDPFTASAPTGATADRGHLANDQAEDQDASDADIPLEYPRATAGQGGAAEDADAREQAIGSREAFARRLVAQKPAAAPLREALIAATTMQVPNAAELAHSWLDVPVPLERWLEDLIAASPATRERAAHAIAIASLVNAARQDDVPPAVERAVLSYLTTRGYTPTEHDRIRLSKENS